MALYLITVMDKELIDEPDVGMAVVDGDHHAAQQCADAMIDSLREVNRCRCIPHIREIQPGFHYRVGALIKLQRSR